MAYNPEYARQYRERNKERIQAQRDATKEERRLYAIDYYANNKDDVQRKNKDYYDNNREAVIAQKKAYNMTHADKKKNAALIKKYGITLQEYRTILSVQPDCPICGCKLQEKGHAPSSAVVDHCHETGLIRGIICLACNTGLGMFRDNIAALMNAKLYLQKWSN